MKKGEFIERLAEKLGVNKSQAEAFVDAFETTIIDTLQKGDDVTLTGFGTFMAKTRSARMGVNPQNPSERIQIPEVIVPKFKAGKTLKDALKQGRASQAASASAEQEDTGGGSEETPAEPTME